MKKNSATKAMKVLLFMLLISLNISVFGQQTKTNPKTTTSPQKKSTDFWNHVQFGGGIGGGFGNQYSNLYVAPSAIYNFNSYFSAGTGLQMSYVSSKDEFNNMIVGGSLIGLFNPSEFIQLSAELEELNVSSTNHFLTGTTKSNFWNTGLFFGIGYRTDNVTLGVKYNLLFNPDNRVYTTGLMPFVRVYF
ncbi:hypothetical protein OX284_000380 [Flavobacterium sp. SUN046]|uniref:hypothetical protein n=1 Tax=Flavobacterium sp. SUN046 TaxID=3002440 RepID=UPI002DB6368F|nr:hypothetical protein [Flavobacterium sp. SUN046]MEC4047869.1 hypothetical protein [Flavobacterium sp. SUN046]